jgi:branched-chain amino acid transport system substrate-binding protein
MAQQEVSRRDFLKQLGVTVGAAAVGGVAGHAVVPQSALAQAPPKGKIPDSPLKVGHITFLSGPSAVLGAPMLKGHTLAAEEINAAGGLLGKRKIETITADEAVGTDGVVKEFKRMKLEGKIDVFTGITSSANTPALGPVAEDLKVLTLFADGCTDFLFDKAVPNPKYVFRLTNIQSADGVTAAIATAMTWPDVRRIAHIHPDYAYGRNAFDHFTAAIKKLLPGTEIVSESWPKLGTTDFTPHIPKIISSRPDLLVSSVWGGDYIAFYKQALGYGLFKQMKFTSTIAFGVAPHAIGKDHPEGVIAGVHANYYWNFPPGNKWPLNNLFIRRYFNRWKEYPNFEAEGAYTALYMLKTAVEKANRLMGGWPDDEAIISQLEGLMYPGPAGYYYIRPDNHQAYKDAMTGFSHNDPNYQFQVLDPSKVIVIPIRSITAPPGYQKGEPTTTFRWIEETWPRLRA